MKEYKFELYRFKVLAIIYKKLNQYIHNHLNVICHQIY